MRQTRTSFSEISPSQVIALLTPKMLHFAKFPLVSQRGVVFFRAQDELDNELQKKLILRLGELTGRPATSGLHVHPILNSEREEGGSDPEISTISSVQHKRIYRKEANDELSPKKQNSAQWHSDIAFEPVPADYTSLRLVELPSTGGGESRLIGYITDLSTN